jgi:hypothetical protein
MKFKGLAIFALVFLVVGALGIDASASACRHAGSCLLFPFFKTDPGTALSVISITNTGPETVIVRIVWVTKQGDHCITDDDWIELTDGDTFTYLDSALAPVDQYGFSYAYVVDGDQSEAEVKYNYLIGQEYVFVNPEFDSEEWVVSYAVNAASYQALDVPEFDPEGSNYGGDGELQLDGVEFTMAPTHLYFPKFFAQPVPGDGDDHLAYSWLNFMNLTGGKFFGVTVKFHIWNDNEHAWSANRQYDCYDWEQLADISDAFTEEFILGSIHEDDADEPYGFADLAEVGWFEMWGIQATYDILSYENPSVYAVLVETCGDVFGGADLPFQEENPDDFNFASLYPQTIPQWR